MLALRLLAAPAVLAGVATVGCARTSTPAPQLRAPPFLELRLAFKDSAAGRERIYHAGTTAFLAPEALLTDEDLLSVRAFTRPDGLILDVRHRPSERLATGTARHVGYQMALLLDSRVRNLAVIVGPIGAG